MVQKERLPPSCQHMEVLRDLGSMASRRAEPNPAVEMAPPWELSSSRSLGLPRPLTIEPA